MLLKDNMNRLIIENEQYYSNCGRFEPRSHFKSRLSLIVRAEKKNDVGEKGAGREKTRVESSKREKAGEIEGGMQPKNTMLNISK